LAGVGIAVGLPVALTDAVGDEVGDGVGDGVGDTVGVVDVGPEVGAEPAAGDEVGITTGITTGTVKATPTTDGCRGALVFEAVGAGLRCKEPTVARVRTGGSDRKGEWVVGPPRTVLNSTVLNSTQTYPTASRTPNAPALRSLRCRRPDTSTKTGRCPP